MRWRLISVGVFLWACSGTPGEPGLGSPGGATSFHIEPANPQLTSSGDPNAAFQFRALSRQGEPVAVLWRLSNPDIGTISNTGLFSPCYGGGNTLVRALLQADTTQEASTSVRVSQEAFGIVSIVTLANSADATPARLDSVAGSVDVGVGITAGQLACHVVIGVRIELVGSGSAIPLGSIAFDPAPTTNFVQTFRWDARATQNGSYFLRPVLILSIGGLLHESAGSSLPITVRN